MKGSWPVETVDYPQRFHKGSLLERVEIENQWELANEFSPD